MPKPVAVSGWGTSGVVAVARGGEPPSERQPASAGVDGVALALALALALAVAVAGGEVAVKGGEHAMEVGGGRRWRGEPADGAAADIEQGAVGGERMQMDVKREIGAKALQHRDDAGSADGGGVSRVAP